MSCKDCNCDKKENGCSCFGNGVVIPNGPDGANGLSAYEVALENGFVGTESEWLDSLVGPQGEQGPQGIPGEPGEPGECDCEIVRYDASRSFEISGEPSAPAVTSFIATQDGLYEYFMLADVDFDEGNEVDLSLRINGSQYSPIVDRRVAANASPSIIPAVLFASQIPMTAGDILAVTAVKANIDSVFLINIIVKVTKIG